MVLELSVLAIAAAVLSSVVIVSNQLCLLLATSTYAAAVVWLVHRDLTLLLPALGIAIAVGLIVLGRSFRSGWLVPSQLATSKQE